MRASATRPRAQAGGRLHRGRLRESGEVERLLDRGLRPTSVVCATLPTGDSASTDDSESIEPPRARSRPQTDRSSRSPTVDALARKRPATRHPRTPRRCLGRPLGNVGGMWNRPEDADMSSTTSRDSAISSMSVAKQRDPPAFGSLRGDQEITKTFSSPTNCLSISLSLSLSEVAPRKRDVRFARDRGESSDVLDGASAEGDSRTRENHRSLRSQ